MYPGMMHWWMHRRWEGDCRPHAGCGTGRWGRWEEPSRGRWTDRHTASGDGGDFGAGAFGVRRPLRFLAYKLGLDDRQVGELARILNALKTERAQAEVDARRAMAGLADAVAAAAFDTQATADAAAVRVRSAERLRDAVTTALGELHALLDPEQRAQLAYLIRTGTLQV
jgi:Spy/CpxP family protein refolding chaperone